MTKAVSAIIATILLLMITIALAGTAYIYMSGMIGGRTSKAFSVLDASCSGTTITLVISNDGTVDITGSGVNRDLRIYVNDQEDMTFVFNPVTITPHSTSITELAGTSGANKVLIISPSNVQTPVVYC